MRYSSNPNPDCNHNPNCNPDLNTNPNPDPEYEDFFVNLMMVKELNMPIPDTSYSPSMLAGEVNLTLTLTLTLTTQN